ncbi:carbohydrate ABC transporter permease [Saccharothrix longispora]|uniref:Raffinose/stachyose/melibiose transport system permease protein n=1 Tax=Saccharothrix longispora TaxID=33920 RepID=A0ABU1PU10_9PSEU|nr:carbohydrate ABC transporter permease [Saccharothrix longispora]MDR6594132.1 raffinose/stachyose/melibiose transport system permease protein [Saccharothrix longispora]
MRAGLLVRVGLAVVTVLPLAELFVTALHPPGTYPPGLTWPDDPHWSNFALAFRTALVDRALLSGLVVVLAVVPAVLVLSTAAGYGLARLPFPGSRAVLGLFVVGLVLPREAIVVPLYQLVRDLGLLDTTAGLVLPLVAVHLPFGVVWMRTHFASADAEPAECARVDGAGPWAVFRHVHLPLAGDALRSSALLLSVWTWNHLLFALVLVDDPLRRTAAGALGAFQGRWGTDVPLLCAGALLITAPVVVPLVLLRRRFADALVEWASVR